MVHQGANQLSDSSYSLVDYNRAGTPLSMPLRKAGWYTWQVEHWDRLRVQVFCCASSKTLPCCGSAQASESCLCQKICNGATEGSDYLWSSLVLYLDAGSAGVPLLEIVTEPDLRSGAEAAAYGAELRRVVTFLGISNGNMQACLILQ